MKPVQVLALGRFQPEDLLISVSESNRKIDPAIEAQIDARWEATQKKAAEEGRVCYNGISYRLNSLEIQENKIRLDLGLLEYKAREALPTIPGYYDLPEEYWRKGCYSGATVKTSDDKYLIVELSGKSMNMNRVDVLGGIIEKPTEISDGKDLFGSLYAELEEEGCIHVSDIETSYLRAIYRETKTNIGFYFEILLKISSEEILERSRHEMHDQDIRSLRSLTPEEYMDMLRTEMGSPGKQLMADIIAL